MAKVYKSCGTDMARLASKSAVLDEAAAKIKARAEAAAATHKKTSRYSGNFRIGKAPGKKGVVDRYVYNDHHAALAIEYGHFAENRDGNPGRFVPGQFNLHKGLGA
ncbi:hypothetical protein GP475_08775 [Corynebacterium poyangense]|uniref:HK97 gp10 family phage protein n=1 Tax=Corynebacterium poyangense TaxID=2684405 RepID=A0A7H0SQ95_9CORY|nr:DUF5403 family protein [Corynebacterium poyangense]QNQ90720.1 hypothetical protein GP475_08775 [Corynebacterium poyangense]